MPVPPPPSAPRGEIAGWPVLAPGLMMAVVDRLLVVHIDERLTPTSFARYRTEWLASVDAREAAARGGAFYSVPAWAGFTAAMRKEWAAMLKSREVTLRATTAGMALSTPSVLVRGAVSAVFWLAPPPYPHAVVDRDAAAFDFLATKLPGLDVRACARAYAALLARYHAEVR